MSIDRSFSSPLSLVRLFLDLLSICLSERPNLVHLVTIQPLIVGGIVARILSIKAVVFAISGLGSVFSGHSLISSVRRFFVLFLYKLSFGVPNKFIIFQNSSDYELLSRHINIADCQYSILNGSGVDTQLFSPCPQSDSSINILMASRLLVSKGVWEYVDACKVLSLRFPSVKFFLAGSPDPSNPSSLSERDLSVISSIPSLNFLGQCTDIFSVMQKCSIFVLPSYYPEGMPKVICEALSCGLPVITTDTPGCRDAIIPNVTGLLVPTRDVDSLVNSILYLIADRSRLTKMSINARNFAIDNFDVSKIVSRHLEIYDSLLH